MRLQPVFGAVGAKVSYTTSNKGGGRKNKARDETGPKEELVIVERSLAQFGHHRNQRPERNTDEYEQSGLSS